MHVNTTYTNYYLYLLMYFKYWIYRWDILNLYAFVLYYPQDGDLSPKYTGEFTWMNNLLFYPWSAFVGVYGLRWLVGSLIGSLVI